MEGGSAVCYLTGAMNSLLNKLHKLEKTHLLVDAFLQDLEGLRKDLQDSFSGGPATGEQLKVWRKQVRELVYDMEDWIDPRLAAELGESVTEQTQIENFKARIQEARGRCTRYGLLSCKAPNTDANLVDAAPSKVTVYPGLLWKKKNPLVGMDGPRRDLEKHLNDKRSKMKVVSIVGEGGHGKTTLAKEMDQKFKGQFDCQAFLSLRGNTSTRTTLFDILHQVKPSADDAATWDEQRVITELWGFLRTKRYFIIIDDIRSTCTWEVISGALPYNNHGSRILTTTCIKDIAISCSRRPSDVVYQMKDLGEKDSRSLLDFMISARKEDRPVDLEEVSGQMLKVCGGIPFAIILTAALLDWKSAQLGPRKMVKKSILPLLDQHSMSAGMRKILEISFDDLPLPLKSCFLYMSVFPENCVVEKNSLIRRWIAEGFICKIDEESLLETGESYFNELVSRELIHPVLCNDDFEPIGCTVHGVVADFIKSLSSKENFVTTGEELSSGSFRRDRTRRFLLNYSGQREAGGTDASIMVHISRARTLTVVGDVKEMSDLSAFRLVRVLDLEGTRGLRNHQLKGIGCLVLLKYLGLAGTSVTELPEEIMALTHLETLDIRRTRRLRNFEALRNAKLVSLLADDVQLPSKMVEALLRLEELSTVLVDGDYKPEDAAQLVSKLQQLKVLSVRANDHWDQRDMKLFFQALKDSKLMSLALDCSLQGLDNWTPSSSLRRFQLKQFLTSVPQDWVSLDRLTHLDIRIEQVEPSDAVVLGKLPSLILLKLDARNYCPEGRVTIDGDGFPKLKVAWFLCHSGGMGLQLEFGAMEQLQRLRLDFNVRTTRKQYGNTFDFGIQFPRRLTQVHVTVNCSDSTLSDVLTAEDAIRDQVRDNPGKPYCKIVRDGVPLPMDKDEDASPSGVKPKLAERF